MYMTNKQIIDECKAKAGIPLDEELHTYAIWKSLGYQVQKGQKAIISTKLWKSVRDKKDDKEKMILVNSSLFSYSQVKKIEQ